MTFDFLPGTFLRALIKLGFCGGPLGEKVCYDFMELVVGMDSKNIDKVSDEDDNENVSPGIHICIKENKDKHQ